VNYLIKEEPLAETEKYKVKISWIVYLVYPLCILCVWFVYGFGFSFH